MMNKGKTAAHISLTATDTNLLTRRLSMKIEQRKSIEQNYVTHFNLHIVNIGCSKTYTHMSPQQMHVNT